MRTIYRLNGEMIDVDAIHNPPLIIGDTAYPVLRPFIDRLGIVKAQVDEFPDLRLFDCIEDRAGNLTITPKPPEIIAAQEIAESNRLIQVQIESLEADITERRKREAILLVDGAIDWIKEQDEKIEALRSAIK